MPTHMRFSIGWQVNSLLPRDQHTMNPCFRHSFDPLTLTGVDWQTLVDDMHAAITTWTVANSRQLTVKVYEIKDPVDGVPNRPKASKVSNTGASAVLTYPGEVCVCLSYYGGSNGPSQRGRLYVPLFAMGSGPSADRPTSTQQNKAGALIAPFAALGGANVDFGVWSTTRKEFTKATNWYVDDEFDTQRRRGLKPTARVSGTTSG